MKKKKSPTIENNSDQESELMTEPEMNAGQENDSKTEADLGEIDQQESAESVEEEVDYTQQHGSVDVAMKSKVSSEWRWAAVQFVGWILVLAVLVFGGIRVYQYFEGKTKQNDDQISIKSLRDEAGSASNPSGQTKENVSTNNDSGAAASVPESSAGDTTPQEKPVNIENKSVSILILNGSGVTGAAKKSADILTTAGFINVKTANAATQDHIGQVVYASQANETAGKKAVELLTGTYSGISYKLAATTEQKKADVVVMIGK